MARLTGLRRQFAVSGVASSTNRRGRRDDAHYFCVDDERYVRGLTFVRKLSPLWSNPSALNGLMTLQAIARPNGSGGPAPGLWIASYSAVPQPRELRLHLVVRQTAWANCSPADS